MTTNGRRALVLAAMCTALVWTCCVNGAAAAESDDWRPCRAAGHRRYDLDVHGHNDRVGHGYEDFTDGGDGGETAADDDEYNDDGDGGRSDEGYFRSPVDDKPKRGAVKQYEKKPDPRRPAPYAADAAPANGVRADATLLRGETVELPTYVNVPVTLKCRFEPVDGSADKFDTVVEAMYPGHRDAAPPPPSSHASRILKQLMGSVEGWRGVAHHSGRTVRRASGNRYGRREWPAGDDEAGDGYDLQVAWDVLARQRAADRVRRIHDSRRDFRWPEWFHERSARLLQQRTDGRPVAVWEQSENQSTEDRRAEQDVYDRGVDDPRVDQDYDQQVDGRQAEQGYDLQQVEPHIYDLQQVESVDGSQQVESVDDSQQMENVDDSQRVESVDDSPQVERFEDSQQVERSDDQLQLDGRQVERVGDRAAAEEVDERRAEGGSPEVEGQQQLRRDMTATTAPETATAVVLDFAKFRKGIPVRTYVGHAYTTDSTF